VPWVAGDLKLLQPATSQRLRASGAGFFSRCRTYQHFPTDHRHVRRRHGPVNRLWDRHPGGRGSLRQKAADWPAREITPQANTRNRTKLMALSSASNVVASFIFTPCFYFLFYLLLVMYFWSSQPACLFRLPWARPGTLWSDSSKAQDHKQSTRPEAGKLFILQNVMNKKPLALLTTGLMRVCPLFVPSIDKPRDDQDADYVRHGQHFQINMGTEVFSLAGRREMAQDSGPNRG
jgi:hypothetical protein